MCNGIIEHSACRTKIKPELVSPAGDFACLKAAVNCGCDAVYLGGRNFSARAGAGNFGSDELEAAFGFCHLRGVKAYVAVNTLYTDGELNGAVRFVYDCAGLGADAFIIQDAGLARALRRAAPELALHASTQMTVKTLGDAEFLREAGFKRVVLSRELSAEEIGMIAKSAGVETEVFVHGALCVCYSGQCLMSSMLGTPGYMAGRREPDRSSTASIRPVPPEAEPRSAKRAAGPAERSGNLGTCAQPCRLKYSLCSDEKLCAEGYLLSPRDINAIGALPALAGAVTALKIEGRMRNARYAGLTASLYRRAIDGAEIYRSAKTLTSSVHVVGKCFPRSGIDTRELRGLEQIFCRGGGSTAGYLFDHAGRNMMSAESPKNSGLPCGKAEAALPDGRWRIAASADVVPGDGVEIWTADEPHPGAGVSEKAGAGGFFTVRPGPGAPVRVGDRVFKTFDKALEDYCDRLIAADTRKTEVRAEFEAAPGKSARLVLKYGNAGDEQRGSSPRINQVISIEEFSGIPAQAAGKAAAADAVRRNLSKTGGTPFNIVWERFSDAGGVFLPVSEINALRRRALERLTREILAAGRQKAGVPNDFPPARELPAAQAIGGNAGNDASGSIYTGYSARELPAEQAGGGNAGNDANSTNSARRSACPEYSAQVYSPEQIPAVLSGPLKIGRLILELPDVRPAYSTGKDARREDVLAAAASACLEAGAAFYIALPAAETGEDSDFAALDADGFLIRTWGQLRALGKRSALSGGKNGRGAGCIADYTLPAWNREAADFLSVYTDSITVSPEFDPGGDAWEGVSLEKIVYGRIPLMTTRQCPVGNFAAKRGEGGFSCGLAFGGKGFRLTDRKNAEYPVIPRCGTCDALIMSSKPVSEKPRDWRRRKELGKYASLRLIFTTEDAEEIGSVLEQWG